MFLDLRMSLDQTLIFLQWITEELKKKEEEEEEESNRETQGVIWMVCCVYVCPCFSVVAQPFPPLLLPVLAHRRSHTLKGRAFKFTVDSDTRQTLCCLVVVLWHGGVLWSVYIFSLGKAAQFWTESKEKCERLIRCQQIDFGLLKPPHFILIYCGWAVWEFLLLLVKETKHWAAY